MPVFRWGQNWGAFRDLEREVDRLLEGVNLTFQGLRLGNRYPLINLYDQADEYLLTAELPGTRAEDIEITFANGVLSMVGEREPPESVSDEHFRRQERFVGKWQRSLSLPDRIEEEGMSADFEDGILRIHLPKVAEVKPRKIPVSDGS